MKTPQALKQLWHNLLSRLARPLVERAFAAGYAAGKRASSYGELPY